MINYDDREEFIPFEWKSDHPAFRPILGRHHKLLAYKQAINTKNKTWISIESKIQTDLNIAAKISPAGYNSCGFDVLDNSLMHQWLMGKL